MWQKSDTPEDQREHCPSPRLLFISIAVPAASDWGEFLLLVYLSFPQSKK